MLIRVYSSKPFTLLSDGNLFIDTFEISLRKMVRILLTRHIGKKTASAPYINGHHTSHLLPVNPNTAAAAVDEATEVAGRERH